MDGLIFNNLLCFFGLHRWVFTSKFLPSIHAEIVTDFISHAECKHCKKIEHNHLVWDGVDMIDKIDG